MTEDQIAFMQTKKNAVNMATISSPHGCHMILKLASGAIGMMWQ